MTSESKNCNLQDDNNRTPVLVVGSTGKTGRRVVQRLEQLGIPVRHGSRSAEIPFDWEDPATWAPALEGIKRTYVAFHPDLAVPGAPEAITRFTRLARSAGVERLVLLSGRGEEEALRCEQIVADSGLTWTVVRAAWFNQNFSEGFMGDMVLDGVVALPTGGVREPFVDVEDIADVAVAALTRPGLENRVYEVTGPRLMTFREAVEEIAVDLGRHVEFVEVPHEDFLAGARNAGVPEDFLALLDYLLREVLDGRNESLASGVRDALGRPARDFQEYVRETVSSGVWSTELAR
mgnify:CR=1 FL=1